MSRPYSPLAVLRAVPADLLAAYCAAHAVPLDPDALAPAADAKRVMAAADRLPAGDRRRFEAALRDVHDLGTDDGSRTLVAEARFRDLPLGDEFDRLDGPAARALWFLARHREAFHAARLVYAADHLAARYSTTVAGLPAVRPDHTPEALGPLRRALAGYYQDRQARGRRCHLDALPRGDRLLVFGYLDDYPAVHLGFDDADTFRRRPHRPAFELVFQFTVPAGTLAVFARGESRLRVDLLDLFCRHLLGVPVPAEVLRRPPFRLGHLLRAGATAAVPPDAGVLAARVRRLRVYLPDRGETVTLETAATADADAVYRMLDRHFPTDLFPRDGLWVTAATVAVSYQAGEKPRALTFEVTARGSTTLAAEPEDRQAVGERVLRAWGVTDA